MIYGASNSEFKILVVDDVPKNIQVVGNILQEHDYDIYFAADGATALSQVEKYDFDLILLDIMMPGIDGYEVCRRVKLLEKAADIPIIFLTAKSDVDSIVKGFDVGGIDYITKPFNGAELLARVRNQLQLQYSQSKLKEANLKLEDQKLELQEANDRLHTMTLNLKELNATKDKFFSIIAHDLKNPFNTLIGFSDLLVQNYEYMERDQVSDIHKTLHKASNQALNLLENLLDWARSQTGKLQIKPQSYLLKTLAKDAILLLQHIADEKQIYLVDEVDEKQIVFADSNMITTVIRNLISNAIKFTQNGGTVKVCTIGNYKNNSIFTIEDNGIGISKSDIEKLFRIDVNHSTVGTNKESGTGLGLILCKEFVEKNHGTISVESEPGKGSKFLISLPTSQTQSSFQK